MKVRILKQNHASKIVIPDELDLPENMEYQLIVDDDGVISLIPISDNVFAANPDYNFRSAIEAMQLGDSGNPIGKEDVWWFTGGDAAICYLKRVKIEIETKVFEC